MTHRLIFALMAFSAVGCALPELQRFKPNPSKTQSEAGSTHLAIQSVTPVTDDVLKALAPQFKSDGDAALEKVAPYTGSFRQTETSSSGVAINIDLGPDAQKGSAPSSAPNDQSNVTAAQPGPIGDTANFAEVDPFLGYSAAGALHQEISILNNYIYDFPKQSDYAPFIVRVQLAVIPKKRNQPYDVYSDLSFFAERDDPKSDGEAQIDAAKVIPILASENLERSRDALRQDALRSLQVGLAGLTSGVGFGGIGNSTQRNLIDALANDYNGLFTIGRVTDNVIRARFGALQVAGDFYEMIPRTHNVSLFVLAPKGTSRLQVFSEQTMRDAQTGEELPRGETFRGFGLKLAEVMGSYRYVRDASRPECQLNANLRSPVLSGVEDDQKETVDFAAKRLRSDVVRGDYAKFRERFKLCFKKLNKSTPDPDDLKRIDLDREYEEVAQIVWIGLSTIQADLPNSYVEAELPMSGAKVSPRSWSTKPPDPPK